MSDHGAIDAALSMDELKLPAGLRVVRVEWQLYEDSSGDDALKVWVVLDDRTTDREIERAPILAVKTQIINSLRRHGVTLFPYFGYSRESELGALVEDA